MTPIQFRPSARTQLTAWLAIFFAICVTIHGLVANPERTWANLLLDGCFMTSLAVSATFFIATQRLAGARWSAGMRRVPEALMLTLPVFGVLIVLLYFGRRTLFPWARPGFVDHEPADAGYVEYLKAPYVYMRTLLSLVVWVTFAWLLRRASIEQDGDAHRRLHLHYRLNKYAAGFVVAFAITFTTAVYDWLGSLEPHWFSTMFAVYVFAGTHVQGLAAIVLITVLLRKRYLANAGDDKLHKLGTMLFAFSIFWSYIWTCQYLLIWYGNIPEEVTHYADRTNGSWVFLFALNPVINGLVPFLGLLSARAKRRPRLLATISVLLLAGHWLDLYLQILPAFGHSPQISLTEFGLITGYVALGYIVFVWNLAKAPLVPLNDPILASRVVHASREQQARHVGALE